MKTSHHFKQLRTLAISLMAIAVLALGCGSAWASCPAQGSGATGVAAFAAACSAPADNPATTCNGHFSINLKNVGKSGSLVTFTYDVCRLTGSPHAISHFVVGLGQISCLRTGATLADFVVGAQVNGEPVAYAVGTDPTTLMNGVKIDTFPAGTDFSVGKCITFSFTFDESQLNDGFILDQGVTLGSTKAGNQDITRTNRESPGYACIAGPVCRVDLRGDEGCTPGYWKNHLGAWAATGFSPTQSIQSVFSNASGTIATTSLHQGLSFKGGSTIVAAKQILMRAAIAALLSAAHPDVNYPRTVGEVVADVNAALLSENRATVLDLATSLDTDNNLGCPLN